MSWQDFPSAPLTLRVSRCIPQRQRSSCLTWSLPTPVCLKPFNYNQTLLEPSFIIKLIYFHSSPSRLLAPTFRTRESWETQFHVQLLWHLPRLLDPVSHTSPPTPSLRLNPLLVASLCSSPPPPSLLLPLFSHALILAAANLGTGSCPVLGPPELACISTQSYCSTTWTRDHRGRRGRERRGDGRTGGREQR